jgi:hypothetical protein
MKEIAIMLMGGNAIMLLRDDIGNRFKFTGARIGNRFCMLQS